MSGILPSSTGSAELAAEIDEALELYISVNSSEPDRKLAARNNLAGILWDNKAGIVAYLRSRGAAQTETKCCKGLAPASECQCEIERKAAGFPPYYRGQPTQGGDKGEAVAFVPLTKDGRPQWAETFGADDGCYIDYPEKWRPLYVAPQQPLNPAYESRNSVIEECAKVAEAQKQQFLSTQYAANQPFGSLCERFACDHIAKAIRALAIPSTDRGGA